MYPKSKSFMFLKLLHTFAFKDYGITHSNAIEIAIGGAKAVSASGPDA